MSDDAKELAVRRLDAELGRALATRESPADRADRARALREWQAARLARTHADLAADPTTAAAARFFLDDLYGPRDLGPGLASVRRILPLMKRTLPAHAIETVADAVELDALSQSLDAAMILHLPEDGGPLDAARYGDAYRATARGDDRARQIALVRHLGHSLEKLTEARFVGAALSAMRKPARLAGFGDLQGFLERGYAAFRQMGGARAFVDTVCAREAAISAALFAGDDSWLMTGRPECASIT